MIDKHKLSKSQLEKIISDLAKEREKHEKHGFMRGTINNAIIEYELIYKENYGVFFYNRKT